MLGPYLTLFASAEIFIFVFIEIVTKLEPIERVITKTAQFRDYIILVVLFGLFSIFGTYVGMQTEYDSIMNIRDIGPIVAGLIAGPYAGLAVGLIGGIQRLSLGGASAVACSLGTILAGLLAGALYHFSKGKLPGIVLAMIFGALMELMHGILILVLVNPFSVASTIFMENIPQMIIANSLGVGICIIVIHSRIEMLRIIHSK
ncbi:LytS/YhcK type 5TM receptor domain-containing protein [Methanoregula sp.]|uniref:LytS/YhcK type 5TM receptor domain-containing protein n=1 Tax=Methanoregula sp. TaxID=2052170 RepID=UPI0035662994